MKIQHVPWAPQPRRHAEVEEGSFSVDGLEGRCTFAREVWPFGGYVAHALCLRCAEVVKAGGRAGEAGVIRWAWAHRCDAEKAAFEVDEDTNLFRS